MRRRNLLVISDLHLGEGLGQDRMAPGSEATSIQEVGQAEHLQHLERELSSFLIHYTAERINGRPWRLIINGDMVDFMSILLFPDSRRTVPQPSQVASSMLSGDIWGEESVFGLGTGAEQSRLKLERVIDHHAALFQLLGKFIAAGNDLVVILGNHDMEFSHREVQRTFVRRLCEMAGDPDLSRRVRFCSWFYYEKDRIYIEHGHQYDEYCSFDYQLCPASTSGGLALSFAHTGMRFFGNLVPSYDQRTAERWGMLDYIKWGISLGIRPMLWLAYLYGLLAWKASEIGALLRHPKEDTERRRRHQEELQALSREFRIQEEKLHALDELRVVPAVRRLGKILAVLFLDRVLLLLLSVPSLAALVYLSPGRWKIGSALAVLGLALLANYLMHRFRGVTSPTALRRVTRAIHKIIRAPLIVFGHSHEPERVPLPEGGVYYNTGTWMKDGSHLTGTHLVIHSPPHGQGLHVEMRKWHQGSPIKMEL